jgi:hypothetical protein
MFASPSRNGRSPEEAGRVVTGKPVERQLSAKLALRADELQAVVDYRAALRASIAASREYASARTPAEASKLEGRRDSTNLRVWETLRALQEVLRGEP